MWMLKYFLKDAWKISSKIHWNEQNRIRARSQAVHLQCPLGVADLKTYHNNSNDLSWRRKMVWWDWMARLSQGLFVLGNVFSCTNSFFFFLFFENWRGLADVKTSSTYQNQPSCLHFMFKYCNDLRATENLCRQNCAYLKPPSPLMVFNQASRNTSAGPAPPLGI